MCIKIKTQRALHHVNSYAKWRLQDSNWCTLQKSTAIFFFFKSCVTRIIQTLQFTWAKLNSEVPNINCQNSSALAGLYLREILLHSRYFKTKNNVFLNTPLHLSILFLTAIFSSQKSPVQFFHTYLMDDGVGAVWEHQLRGSGACCAEQACFSSLLETPWLTSSAVTASGSTLPAFSQTIFLYRTHG